MFKKIDMWCIKTFGPYSHKLQKLIVTVLHKELQAREYDMHTCTFVGKNFGLPGLEWYRQEFIDYIVLVYPGVYAYSTTPFAYISGSTGRTNEQERELFINYMLAKYE